MVRRLLATARSREYVRRSCRTTAMTHKTDFERGAEAMREVFAEREREYMKHADRQAFNADTAADERFWDAERDLAKIRLQRILAAPLPSEK